MVESENILGYLKEAQQTFGNAVFITSNGIGSLTHTAMAAILAFSLSELTGDKELVNQAKSWMTGVEHLLDSNGRFNNFIYGDSSSTSTLHSHSSFPGGQEWQSRGIWALAKAYRMTGDEHWLDLYWKASRMLRPSEAHVMAIFNLAKVEVSRTGINQPVIPVVFNPYYRAEQTSNYYQLYSGVMSHAFQNVPLVDVKHAVNDIIAPMVNAGFWDSFKQRDQGINNITPSIIGPIALGLGALSVVTNNEQNELLFDKAFTWFEGNNSESRKMADSNGRCFDSVFSDEASPISSIHYGFTQVAMMMSESGALV